MTENAPGTIPIQDGEFWTSRQRQMHSLHYTISYRGSFKPELPDYFIKRFTKPGDIVVDPFCGRGTTILQANLLGRTAWANDINPLAAAITKAKVNPVPLESVRAFLSGIEWEKGEITKDNEDLLAFYHYQTLAELCLLKKELACHTGKAARFVELLALSRLHGHSSGFFSVYSMPQIALPVQSQLRINSTSGRCPDYRAIAPRILNKAAAALHDNCVMDICRASSNNRYLMTDARDLSSWPAEQAALVVTSPPFLDKVDYLAANWLELWFLDISPSLLFDKLLMTSDLEQWCDYMSHAILEFGRILCPGGFCVIEVGDISYHGKRLNLDEIVCDLAFRMQRQSRLVPCKVLVQRQYFSKLSHCFNVTNNCKGTNTQRLLILEKKNK